MAWNHSKTRQERGYGAEWQRIRLRIMGRDMWLCQTCLQSGRPTPATQVDHITPKAKGGTDEDENLQAICEGCHKEKTARDSGYRPKVQIGLDGWPAQ